MRSRACLYMLFALAALSIGISASAETVDVSTMTTVTFVVSNVSSSTSGSPNPTTISFSNAQLLTGKALRISVRADNSSLTPPSGSAIPVSKITWTASGVGGTAFDGTVSSASYTQVYRSNANPGSGSVNIAWSLAAPGSNIRAGDHMVTLTWMFESVTP